MTIQQDATILFQGDSITDAGRNRQDVNANSSWALGAGYAHMSAATLLCRNPSANWRFHNRGISGNRVTDLFERWTPDALALKPDVISILIGVNDTWHGFNRNAGVPVPQYEQVYRDLLNETKAALPRTQLVLCEPFTLPCGAVTGDWTVEMQQRRAIVRQFAQEFGAVFVPFQSEFDAAAVKATPQYWAADGVHPTPAGHMLMAQFWLKCVCG